MLGKLLNIVNRHGNIYIFGTGESGIIWYKYLKDVFSDSKIMFLDNDIAKQRSGAKIEDTVIRVLSPSMLENEDDDFVVIISSQRFLVEMLSQLSQIGIADDCIILSEECHKILEENFRKVVLRRTPKKKFSFVVDLAEHCNLNCQMCDHFSPLAKPHFTDINCFERDIRRMKEIFDEDVEHIDLEGGEPLLNPRPQDYVRVVRNSFKSTLIQIFTNGLLLEKMSDEFWDICKENGVILEVTQYPIEFDYEKIRNLAQDRGVCYKVYDGAGVKDSWYKPLDLQGMQDKYESFHNCYMANGECAMLKEGKLYPCTVVPNISTFNSYFGRELAVCEEDYIDIYDDIDKSYIYDFMSNPIPACRYCKVKERSGGHTWKTSRKIIEEWI